MEKWLQKSTSLKFNWCVIITSFHHFIYNSPLSKKFMEKKNGFNFFFFLNIKKPIKWGIFLLFWRSLLCRSKMAKYTNIVSPKNKHWHSGRDSFNFSWLNPACQNSDLTTQVEVRDSCIIQPTPRGQSVKQYTIGLATIEKSKSHGSEIFHSACQGLYITACKTEHNHICPSRKSESESKGSGGNNPLSFGNWVHD